MRIDKTGGEYLLPHEFDAALIESWLNNRDENPALSNSADPDYVWAHENPDAWPLVRLPAGLSESAAKSMMAMAQVAEESATAPTEPRYNPYHAKDGKFTTGNGMGGGGPDGGTMAQLGDSSFREMNHGDAVEEQFQINESMYPDAPSSANRALAERWIPEDTRVFASGDDRMYVKGHAKVTDEGLAGFAKDFDECKTRFPLKHPAAISIEGHTRLRDKATGQQNLAETTIYGDRRSAMFRFSDKVVEGEITMPKGANFHPNGYYHDARRNVVAHEYGHAYQKDPLSADGKTFWEQQKSGLSRYGQTSVWEGYAEAFSDYMTSDQSKWMAATKAYRFKYGWKG